MAVLFYINDRSKAIRLLWLFLFYVLIFKVFVLLAPYVCFHILNQVLVSEWPPIRKKAAYSAYGMFSWYRYLIVNVVFSHLGFWSGNLFLIAPFPDLRLSVPFLVVVHRYVMLHHVFYSLSVMFTQFHFP